MQIKLDDLQRAFTLAHRAGESPLHTNAARDTFRTIAFILWRMAGSPQEVNGLVKGVAPCTDASTN
jgi:hypothetical protein